MLLLVLSITAQTIEKYSIDSGGASTSAGGVEILYTIGEVVVQESSASNFSISEGFINSNFKIMIDPVVYLQGPILSPDTGGLMNDDLRVAGVIPTTSPYADNATCNSSVFSVTGNNAIVDWVWVELRASDDNAKLLNGKSALLQRDGDVVDIDGVSTIIMNAPPKDHYVVVKHRNHLGAMSQLPIFLAEDVTTVVDFTNNLFATNGTNAQAILDSGDTALWAGDVNNSNQIIFSGASSDANVIKDFVLADPSNGFNSVTFSSLGYLLIDVNMNGFGNFSGSGNDSNIIKDNVLAHPNNGFGSSTYIINTTVPSEN